MTIVAADTEGLRRAGRVLDAARAVILPLPTPLPYIVASLDAATVNAAKRRPSGQPVGLTVADFSLMTPHVDLDADTLTLARWLTADQMLNLLLPVGAGRPAWMRPSTSKGWIGVTLACSSQTRDLLNQRGHLYVSSANRTGCPAALTAPAADAAFGGQLLVINGDPARDPSTASGSATIVRVGPRRHLEVVRPGIQDATFTGDSSRFVQHLIRRWQRSRH
jgi:L-threonylcarbamoyladenylate synthase